MTKPKNILNPRNRQTFQFPKASNVINVYVNEEYKRLREKGDKKFTQQTEEDFKIVRARARIIIKDYFDEFGNKGTETKQL